MTASKKGYCACGCGQRTSIAKRNRKQIGHRKGEPVRYILGHSTRRYTNDWDVNPVSGCWNWIGGTYDDGRGRASVDGKTTRAYIWVYEQHVGPVPKDHVLHHRCENPRCVNPEHLEPVSVGQHVAMHQQAYWDKRRAEEAAARVERVARALNDEWAAGSQGARWDALDEAERERWREAAGVALRAEDRVAA